MTEIKNQKKFLIYPDNKYKDWWDMYITIILIFSSIVTPINIAFDSDINKDLIYWENLFTNISFAVDSILMFNTAFYNDSWNLIDDRK